MKLLAPALLMTALAAGPALAGAVPPLPSAPGCAASTCGMLLPVASTGADRQALEAARTAFRALPLEGRLNLQVLLTVLGYWPAVANDSFGPKLMAAIQRFQRDNGTPPTGMPEAQELTALWEMASPLLALWDLQPLRHPFVDATLWVPAGLGLTRESTERGVRLSGPNNDITITFSLYSASDPKSILDVILRNLSGTTVHYSKATDTFFAISFEQDDIAGYSRFEKVPEGLVGFTLSWPNESFFRGERLAVVMSDLFRASVALKQPRQPPTPITGTPSTRMATAPARTQAPPPAHKDEDEDEDEVAASTGTGFYIAPGVVLTNAHVVKGCPEVTTALGGVASRSRVIARDSDTDLALVRTPEPGPSPARLRIGARLGEDIAAFGFPLSGVLASSGNFTRGTITATAGLRDDTRQLQISAPVQPGNSGGPLLDASGNVVGVIVAKLDALKVAAVIDDIPQNINFAIKASMAARFLEEQGVAYTASGPAAALQPADLAALAQTFTVAIRCQP